MEDLSDILDPVLDGAGNVIGWTAKGGLGCLGAIFVLVILLQLSLRLLILFLPFFIVSALLVLGVKALLNGKYLNAAFFIVAGMGIAGILLLLFLWYYGDMIFMSLGLY